MFWMYRAAQVVCRGRQESLPRFTGCAGSDELFRDGQAAT